MSWWSRSSKPPSDDADGDSRRHLLVDVVFGVLVGGAVGAIVAVNVVIFAGVDEGYEANLAEVFRESGLLGTLVILVLMAGPIVGVVLARRRRRSRTR